MKVTTGDFFLYLTFEKDDFKAHKRDKQGKFLPAGGLTNLDIFKAAIPTEERDYDPKKKIWVVENCTYSWKVIEELGGTAEEPSKENK